MFNLFNNHLSDKQDSFKSIYCHIEIILFLQISTGLIPIKLFTRLFHQGWLSQSTKWKGSLFDYKFGKFNRSIRKLAGKRRKKEKKQPTNQEITIPTWKFLRDFF